MRFLLIGNDIISLLYMDTFFWIYIIPIVSLFTCERSVICDSRQNTQTVEVILSILLIILS